MPGTVQKGGAVLNHFHDGLEIMLMSLALGMDAFSLSLGMGLQGINRKTAWQFIFNIGVAHIFMASVGLAAGIALHGFLGKLAIWFGAVLLIALGLHMIYSTLFGSTNEKSLDLRQMAIPLFALTVSVDALSVGFSLGLRSTAYGVVSVVSFGVFGAGLCGIGLWLGKRANRLTGQYGQLFGAAILIAYGIHFLWV